MKPTQEQIAEAAKRGIIEGATIRCVCAYEDIAPVPNPREWDLFGDGGMGFRWEGVTMNRIYIRGSGGRFATVITPAPSKEEGLKEGDAVKTTPKMRDAIVELARELGLLGREYSGTFPNLLYKERYDITGADNSVDGRQYHTPEAFIAKMRVTAAKPKPILIGGRPVQFLSDGAVCTGTYHIDFATLEAVYNKAKEHRA